MMRGIKKEDRQKFLYVVGKHIEKYRVLMLVIASLISAAALTLCIYWEFDENSYGKIWDTIYIVIHSLFLGVSVALIAIIVLNKYKKISNLGVAISTHLYSFLIVAMATTLCISDLSMGTSPMIYILACVAIAGLFIIEPRFYICLVATSVLAIGIYAIYKPYAFFSDQYMVETIIESIAFIVIVCLISIRHYTVTMREYEALETLEKLTYYDELTGLLNERSYMLMVDEITDPDHPYEERFGIVMMDLNNLKNTNDIYGHHFGCHLIIKCGQILPTIFPTSKIYHIGGDEFLAIIQGDDLENFDKRIEDFDNTLLYQEITYEEKTIILSVARGYTIRESGQRYQEAYQIADEKMYAFKKEMKKKYDIHIR